MQAGFLPQAAMVEKLLAQVSEAIPHLADSNRREQITGLLEEFREATTPSAIYLSEIHEYAALQDSTLTDDEALKILKNVAREIDDFCINGIIEQQVDAYLHERQDV